MAVHPPPEYFTADDESDEYDAFDPEGPPPPSKPWYASVTIGGGLGSVATGIAGLIMWFSGADKSMEVLTAAITAVLSGVVAIYGRVQARTVIARSGGQ